MRIRTNFTGKLMLCLITLSPVAFAAPPSDSPYFTDTTNSYVQDETSQAMSSLNSTLCYISAMNPAEMVNLGNYIALVDENICNPNSGGGSSADNNTGANYLPVIVNSSRTDNSTPMIAGMWIEQPSYDSRAVVRLSASQAPNPPADPYGRFRMDYCGMTLTNSTCNSVGFIESTANGLSNFETYTWSGNTGTLRLKLNATSSTTGSGALEQTYTGSPTPAGFAFAFAYDANYFRRSNGVVDACFDRNPANAAESVWSYGLYNQATGARIERNSGFPIEYTNTNGIVTNGYIGYWGLSAQTPVDTSKPVTQVTYSNGTVSKTDYTMLQTGGKLIKRSTLTRTLAQLNKIKFTFWASASVPGVGVPATPATLTSGNYYEVYWDNANTTFRITGQRNSSTYNIVPYGSEVALSIANMKLAAPYGIYGSSNMLGGSFNIPSSAMNALGADTLVKMQTQDVVYPSEFASLGGLMCINNCPTAANIASSNAAPANAPVSPFEPSSIGWTSAGGKALYNYTLDASTGRLVDAASANVVSTATTGNNSSGIYSGRMVAAVDLTLLNDAVFARTGAAAANNYTQPDIDALPTYYEWQTGANSWNQLAILMDANGAPVRFEAPLNVNYSVPNEPKYGTSAGATITLQYGGFGNLWGIPSSCVNSATNLPCTFGAGETANQRWTPEFSIPTGLTSVVTALDAQGAAIATYLVKPLMKEIRLANLPIATCNTANLTVPNPADISLPVFDAAIETSAKSIGNMPVLNPKPAPRVIHGVKKY